MFKLIKKLIAFVVSVVLIAGGYTVYKGREKYLDATEKLSIENAVEKIRGKENYTNYSDVSKTFLNALVAVEDRRFFYHHGIDVFGIARAFKRNFEEKKLLEGGSSITEQLAKNMYFMNDDTVTRKVAEMFVAHDLEKKYSKQEILELYINVIYYGSGYYCIADASEGYFGKDPRDLSDYEATLLAGIPNAPSVYSPNKNPELAEKRQKKVLNSMIKSGYITIEEAEDIMQKGI